MKLGVSYIVFEGLELLEHSIKQIRNHVDYVHVSYQSQSWFGHPIKKEDLVIILDLKKRGLIDEASEFNEFSTVPDTTRESIKTTKANEKSKRNEAMRRCLNLGCTHHLCMDVDEFYVEEQFKNAKDMIEKKGYGLTAVKLINYVTPNLHRGYGNVKVPFICKLHKNSRSTSDYFFVLCDPTRGISQPPEGESHEFKEDAIVMHHMETVRKDLRLKYESTTRLNMDRERTGELMSLVRESEKTTEIDFKDIIFPGMGKIRLTPCENIFGIPFN